MSDKTSPRLYVAPHLHIADLEPPRKTKMHQVADYMQQLLGSMVLLYPHNVYGVAEDGREIIKHRAGEVREEELQRVERDLTNLGCTRVFVRADHCGQLKVRFEMDLP